MTTTTYTTQNGLFISLDGRLDSVNAPNIEFELCRYILTNRDVPQVHLDLATTSYICSAGLRVLLGLAKRLLKQERTLHIFNANELVSEILWMTGFHFFINIDQKDNALPLQASIGA